jgi:hypothetical protein
VAWGVDEIQRVLLAVVGPVEQPHGVGLDGDAALSLQVHRVQHLIYCFLGVHSSGQGQQAIGERGLTVVDVGHDGEIADSRQGHSNSV